MSNDLISRKSVLDYIEKEIAKCESTETLCYLRALSVHINEFEPTAYDIDKVVEQLEAEKKFISYTNFGDFGNMKKSLYRIDSIKAIDIVRKGGIDE